jgi:hypothetical protein
MVGKVIKGVIGLALIGLGVWTIVLWWPQLVALVQGGIGLFLILCGLVALALIAD